MARYQLILAYDGTSFQGYQRQGSKRTVQGELEAVLKQIGWQGRAILSAGRTDTGVHASGQVVAFDLDWQHDLRDLQNALNAKLPGDISVRVITKAADGFHPRFDAAARVYQYRIFFDENRDPVRERYAWRVWPELEDAGIIKAAAVLIGSHDFKAFGRAMKPGESTLRMVWNSEWRVVGENERVYEIKANAFLYHMVRRIVYLLVQCGQGRLNPSDLEHALETGKTVTPGLAPANGLFLSNIFYESSSRNKV